MSFRNQQRLSAELYIDPGDATENETLLKWLRSEQHQIELAYGKELSWEDLPGRRACRIADYCEGEVTDSSKHDEYIDWLFTAYERLRVALGELLAKPASPGMNPAPPLDEAMSSDANGTYEPQDSESVATDPDGGVAVAVCPTPTPAHHSSARRPRR